MSKKKLNKKYCGIPAYFIRKPVEQDSANPLWIQKIMRNQRKKV